MMDSAIAQKVRLTMKTTQKMAKVFTIFMKKDSAGNEGVFVTACDECVTLNELLIQNGFLMGKTAKYEVTPPMPLPFAVALVEQKLMYYAQR